jgi:hypothetical protein
MVPLLSRSTPRGYLPRTAVPLGSFRPHRRHPRLAPVASADESHVHGRRCPEAVPTLTCLPWPVGRSRRSSTADRQPESVAQSCDVPRRTRVIVAAISDADRRAHLVSFGHAAVRTLRACDRWAAGRVPSPTARHRRRHDAALGDLQRDRAARVRRPPRAHLVRVPSDGRNPDRRQSVDGGRCARARVNGAAVRRRSCPAYVTVAPDRDVHCTHRAGHGPTGDMHQGLLRVTLPDGREHAASLVWSTSPVPGDDEHLRRSE